MVGIALDLILMLLLVAALAYGVRLEKKLVALRAGQLAFAGAVTELNSAAGRAENALQSLRASGEEADMLHDRILKARAVKQELEMLIARAPARAAASPSPEVGRDDRASDQGGEVVNTRAALNIPTRASATPQPFSPGRSAAVLDPTRGRENASVTPDDERALRMAALAERIHGLASPAKAAAAPGRENVSAILGAMTANQAAQQSLNRARRSLDEDLFAA